MSSLFKLNQAAKYLNVHTHTLQQWDRDGKLVANRNANNRRYYTKEQLDNFLNQSSSTKTNRKSIGYARVSSNNQKDDLKNQHQYIAEYTRQKGIIIDEYIDDIGSGLNYNRKKWNQLLIDVEQNLIDTIYVTYKDRFIRFGYEWFESFCERHGTKIVVLNDVSTSPEEELVEDLTSIVHVFSSRLYGLRKYKSKVKSLLNSK